MSFKQKTNIGLLIFSIVLNILFFFIPLAGETGFQAFKESNGMLFAMIFSVVPLGFFGGMLVYCIKKW